MALVDWLVVVVFIAAVVGIGLWFTKRASKSMDDYFVAGRTIPWWLAGTSMLATSFAADTPLHTTRMIREQGLGGAWFYWGGILQGVVIAFVFSRLWRRTGVVTDNEFLELRYAGKRAAVLRGGLAVFKCLFLEILTMGWITLGMTKIVKTIMGLSDAIELPVLGATDTSFVVVAVLLVLTLLFSVAAGFWGVVTTDLAEFAVAMVGAVVLSVVSIQKVGGISGLREGLAKLPHGERTLDLTPSLGEGGLTFLAFGVYVGVQWWANAGIDASGQRAQRLLSCKDEQNAIAAGVWSLAVQWIIRSWPWYTAALASMVLYPNLVDHETAYPKMVADLLPIGLKGLMVASFMSAFMATIEAHYNLTASYLMNDVYRRFIAKGRTDAQYVKASRWMTIAVALLAGGLTLILSKYASVMSAFRFKMELMAGLGLVFVLRWFWWRISAASEIAALAASIVTALGFNAWSVTSGGGAHGSALRLLLIVGVSGAVGIGVTFVTKPEPREHLVEFYRRVRPPGAWGAIAAHVKSSSSSDAGAPAAATDTGFGWATLVQVATTLAFVFGCMIGLGKVILGETGVGAVALAIGITAGVVTIRSILRSSSSTEAPTR